MKSYVEMADNDGKNKSHVRNIEEDLSQPALPLN